MDAWQALIDNAEQTKRTREVTDAIKKDRKERNRERIAGKGTPGPPSKFFISRKEIDGGRHNNIEGE